MKAILEYDLPEDREDFDRASKAWSMAIALDEIRNEVFRPARKHGYSDIKIAELIAKNPEDSEELIGLLEEKFYEIMRENGLEFIL